MRQIVVRDGLPCWNLSGGRIGRERVGKIPPAKRIGDRRTVDSRQSVGVVLRLRISRQWHAYYASQRVCPLPSRSVIVERVAVAVNVLSAAAIQDVARAIGKI